MSALTKTPPFILANSRNLEGNHIIHTKEPRFIAKIFNPESEAEAKEIKDKITLHTEIDFKGRKTIIGITELWEPEVSEDKLRDVMKKLKHWYCSILN